LNGCQYLGSVQLQRQTRVLLEFFDRDRHKSLRARRRGNGLSLLAKSALASPVDDTSSAPVSSRIVLAL
jgi:hypothetical protein